jgi:hypothetical protein
VSARQIGLEAAYSSPYVLVQKPVVALVSDGFQERPYLKVVIKAYAYDHRVEKQLQSDVTIRAKSGVPLSGSRFPARPAARLHRRDEAFAEQLRPRDDHAGPGRPGKR